jgi:3-oxoacyl-[acyl-carrier-protein] synthase III
MSQYALTDVVEISDREDLFQIVNNEQVTMLSRTAGGQGFASPAVVERMTGVIERRICRPYVDVADVGMALAETLRRRFNFSWRDCPAIGISHTHTNGDSVVRLVRHLSRELGVDQSKFFYINFGCVGFLELLRLGMRQMDRMECSGPIPLLTVETPEQWHDASDRSFCGIVSAGATGCLLSRGPGHQVKTLNASLRKVDFRPDVSPQKLFWTDTGEFRNFFGEPETRCVMRMIGQNVFEHGAELMIEACRMAYETVRHHDRRVIVASHQPSGKMLRAMIDVLQDEFPCLEFLNHLAYYANSISSAIPTVLSHMNQILAEHGSDPIAQGDYVLIPAAGIAMSHKATHLAQRWAVLEW